MHRQPLTGWLATSHDCVVRATRSQRVGPRVVVLYATSRVLADLARLLQQEEQQEPQEQQQEVEQQQEQLGPAATNSAQVGLHV